MSSWDTEEGFAEDLLDDDDEEEDIPGVQVTTESLPYNYTYLPHKGPTLFLVAAPPPRMRTAFDPPICNSSQPSHQDGVNCEVIKVLEPEVRWRDGVFEKLLPQLWSDYQNRINNDKELYGTFLEPYTFANYETVLDKTGFYLEMQMKDIAVHGLSTIYLAETLVTRSENLSDLDMKMTFKFDKLLINGTYSATGSLGFWSQIDSEGSQNFSVVVDDVTLAPRIKLDTVQQKVVCESDGSAHLSDIQVPLKWADLTIMFENLGSAYNTFFNMAAVYLVNTQEQNLVQLVKEKIKGEVNSLLC